MKYELKIALYTDNIDEVANSFVKICHSHKHCPIGHNDFECPFWYTGCSKITSEDWKNVLKPVEKHND